MTKLRDSVVVITGASSGLGRAVALEMAKRGATCVLAARRGDALEETARACRSAGGSALVVETDVTEEIDVQNLAAKTIESCGRIDVWVNNAGVTLFSALEDAPYELHHRVIETNLMGAILGARAAVPVFRRQKHGVLINVGSILGQVGHAFVPSYAISKFGIHGLSEALRVELADEPDIHVCTVFPYSIDTQHFESSANVIERAARALPPMQSPEKVARAIARLAVWPRRVVHVPHSLVLGLAFHALMPKAAERLLLDALRKWHISPQRQAVTAGNLFEPSREIARTHGNRPPMLATSRFLAWAVLRFARIELEAGVRMLRKARAWLTSRRREAVLAV